jgi:hypothetical protein
MNNEDWKNGKPNNEINGEEFRTISIEKLSMIKIHLDELLHIGKMVKFRTEEEDKPGDTTET